MHRQDNPTLEEVLERMRTSPPLRKIKMLLDRTDLSADMKALLFDIARITVKIGDVVCAIGRRVLQIATTLIDRFPHTTLGLIVAVVLSTILSLSFAGASTAVLGLVVAFQKLITLVGIGAGAIEDLRQNAMKEAMERVQAEFEVLPPALAA